ncbi:MAG: hypothetical protein ABH967_02220 [Patescibacteria group bacterium]
MRGIVMEKTTKNFVRNIFGGMVIGFSVTTILAYILNPNIDKNLKKIPQSTYFYSQNRTEIDIERDGKKDITISDTNRRIKEIMPMEGGYRITINTDEERKNLGKGLEYIK